MKITIEQRQTAILAAREAVEADRRHDVDRRDEAARKVWGAVGYWLESRCPYMMAGQQSPPMMIRRPHAQAIPFPRHAWRAVREWAAEDI